WGYTVETATQGIRMVLSGAFEKYPGLKIILGHLGESLPFSAWRINMALSRGAQLSTFRETFNRHFWITTSGNFCTPALMCCMMEMVVERILFSVDYPFVPNPPGTKWMEELPLSLEDRTKILSGNCKKLLKMSLVTSVLLFNSFQGPLPAVPRVSISTLASLPPTLRTSRRYSGC